MNGSLPNEESLGTATREEIMSALFANMVMQQTNMALMFLGKIPHPETGESIEDIEAAKAFIDQLEMIEFKTKGNLDKREEGLLKQSLTVLRMSFVEAIERRPAESGGTEEEAAASGQEKAPTATEASATETQSPPAGATEEAESRKKFTKKY